MTTNEAARRCAREVELEVLRCAPYLPSLTECIIQRHMDAMRADDKAELAESKAEIERLEAILMDVEDARVRPHNRPCGGGDPGWAYQSDKVEAAICGLGKHHMELERKRVGLREREAREGGVDGLQNGA